MKTAAAVPFSYCYLAEVRFVFSTSPHASVACYKFGVISRITQSVLCILVAVPLMWPVRPVAAQDASLIMAQSDPAMQEQPHGMSSADSPCDLPDCAPHTDCPASMAMSNCDMSEPTCSTCSISGVGVLIHTMYEPQLQRSAAISFRGPPGQIFKHRSISIFHPPRSH